MKRFGLLGALVLLLALASSSTAAAAPDSFNVTLTGNVTKSWDANSCCAWEWVFEGTTNIPSLGHLKFTGFYDQVTQYGVPINGVPSRTVHLYVEFKAPNGDEFAIIGGSDFITWDVPPPRVAWTLYSSNGRFADRSMSGTWTIHQDPTVNASTLAFSFTGAVTKS